ncbi:HoxN/HupN/NixA family nickel/cobalt transporter [Microbispora corallina]|uniref:Nickel/cobalt efflux system n=1 Tax=Microbispora corallina TaxID=83302 RepID=A0ABQ4FYN7_9ACTN|nr:HoxN/HupN/NixA family nickel/cobalt transporter [Microbispora corallina]GIH39908.1 nickel/cobalt efflux system [Microbispora corallina]
MNPATYAHARWTAGERMRIGGIVAVVAVLHIAGWSLYLYYADGLAGAGAFAGAGTLAYSLGIRHAFDADHIAAIDDTTRLMLQRGRRPVGVGFFFALGHSTVVLALALIVAMAAGAAGHDVESFRRVGGLVSQVVAMAFLLLVAVLNGLVLTGVAGLWRRMSRGRIDRDELELMLLNRGLMNRVLGSRVRGLIRSSWHMYPVGLLFGLGLETASEVTLLALSAGAASQGGLPTLAVLTLPLLFAAGMTACDTADSLLMSRAYSWAYRSPARRLYYNAATTGMTVLVAAFIATVYLAALVADATGMGGPLAAYASLADHFEVLGYVIVALFVATWALAALVWRVSGLGRRYAE